MRAAALATLLLVAGCGQRDREAAADAEKGVAPPTRTMTAAPAPVAAPSASVGGLTGHVSGLDASVSDLSTRMTDLGLAIDLPADALFDFDKATLTRAAEAQLQKAADLIRRSPAGPIRVTGHTDAKGDDAYNLRLSEARARTVADWFGRQVGVRTRRFDVAGEGETAPIAADTKPDGADDPVARARNRRVEVLIPKG